MKIGGKQQLVVPSVALAGILLVGLNACSGDKPVTETAAADIVDPTGVRPESVPERQVATDVEPTGAGSKAAGTASEDGALGARVKSALTTHPGLKTLSIDVNAATGAVTLYGTASTPAQRELAGQLALGVDGVKSVTNHLIILRET